MFKCYFYTRELAGTDSARVYCHVVRPNGTMLHLSTPIVGLTTTLTDKIYQFRRSVKATDPAEAMAAGLHAYALTDPADEVMSGLKAYAYAVARHLDLHPKSQGRPLAAAATGVTLDVMRRVREGATV